MSRRQREIYSAVAVVLIAAMAIIFVRNLPGGDHPVIKEQPVVVQSVNYDGTKLTMTPVASRIENGFIVIALSGRH